MNVQQNIKIRAEDVQTAEVLNDLVLSFFKMNVEDAILFMNLNCQLKA
jgi:hypothetical protein